MQGWPGPRSERAVSGRFFGCGGKQFAFTLGRVLAAEADARAAYVDDLLMRLKQRLIELPPGTDIMSFVEQDGKVEVAVRAARHRETTNLGTLRERYLATRAGAQESKSLDTARIHFKHLAATLGDAFLLSELTHSALQGHIDRRSRQGIASVTIKKEVSTLRAAWNWGRRNELVKSGWPGWWLVYYKVSEKPPFQTRAEIERGGLTPEQEKELWQALYLAGSEIDEALGMIRENAAHPWIYPMAATTAFTGARRSELIRVWVTDVDFASNVVVREKKRVRWKLTTRRVPLTKSLAAVLRAYLKTHPGGHHPFCHAGLVERSKKRSRTTGHKSPKDRPSGLKGRLATVHELRPSSSMTTAS